MDKDIEKMRRILDEAGQHYDEIEASLIGMFQQLARINPETLVAPARKGAPTKSNDVDTQTAATTVPTTPVDLMD